MEYCNEARALKSSVRRELTMQKAQHGFFDDFLFMNVMNGDAGSEDFSVDCFFDFVNGEFKEDYIEDEEEEEKDSVSVSSQERVANDDINTNSRSFSSDSLLTNELAVPDDEIAGLEWVSHFVDDSIPELPLSCSVLKQQSENHAKARFQAEPEPVFVKTPCFSSSVPSKTRSKRAKPTGRTWSVGSMPLSESSVSMASSSTSGFSMISTPEPPTKKQKKKGAVQTSGLFDGNPFSQRTCSHCQVQKTPQWRTGPLGAKTLCNACGVRYKSGRLFPEYRPACSPTFSVDMHSNSHRKVLEMRQKKALAGGKDMVESIRNMIPSF